MRSILEGIAAAAAWAEREGRGNETAVLDRMLKLGESVAHIDLTRVMYDVGVDLGYINEDERENLGKELGLPGAVADPEADQAAGEPKPFNPLDPFAADRERRLLAGEHPASIAVDHGRAQAATFSGLGTVVNTTQTIARPTLPAKLPEVPGELQPAKDGAEQSAQADPNVVTAEEQKVIDARQAERERSQGRDLDGPEDQETRPRPRPQPVDNGDRPRQNRQRGAFDD